MLICCLLYELSPKQPGSQPAWNPWIGFRVAFVNRKQYITTYFESSHKFHAESGTLAFENLFICTRMIYTQHGEYLAGNVCGLFAVGTLILPLRIKFNWVFWRASLSLYPYLDLLLTNIWWLLCAINCYNRIYIGIS